MFTKGAGSFGRKLMILESERLHYIVAGRRARLEREPALQARIITIMQQMHVYYSFFEKNKKKAGNQVSYIGMQVPLLVPSVGHRVAWRLP